ncbi:hypothetical protein ABID97_001488 [Variovorax sp. OAS795]
MPGCTLAKFSGVSNLAQRAHLAVGADGDHVVLLALRLAVVLEHAAVRRVPDVLGLAEPGAHVGLGRDAFLQFADALRVASREPDHGRQ